FCPEQITKYSAVGETGRVNAIIIDEIFLSHPIQHRVKEIQILVAHVSCRLICSDFPSGPIALLIDRAWPMGQALRVDHNRLGPCRMNVHELCGALHVAAVPMKREY